MTKTKGVEHIIGILDSSKIRNASDEKIVRIERKLVHGQMVDVKICEPASTQNPLHFPVQRFESSTYVEAISWDLAPTGKREQVTMKVTSPVKKPKGAEESRSVEFKKSSFKRSAEKLSERKDVC